MYINITSESTVKDILDFGILDLERGWVDDTSSAHSKGVDIHSHSFYINTEITISAKQLQNVWI